MLDRVEVDIVCRDHAVSHCHARRCGIGDQDHFPRVDRRGKLGLGGDVRFDADHVIARDADPLVLGLNVEIFVQVVAFGADIGHLEQIASFRHSHGRERIDDVRKVVFDHGLERIGSRPNVAEHGVGVECRPEPVPSVGVLGDISGDKISAVCTEVFGVDNCVMLRLYRVCDHDNTILRYRLLNRFIGRGVYPSDEGHLVDSCACALP